MAPYFIPEEVECFALLERHHTPHHIIQHSKRVRDVGNFLGTSLIEKGIVLDMPLLRASCLLHDIGKYPCIQEGQGYHDRRGEQILEDEGFPEVARIVVQHVILRGSLNDPVKEEHLVFYADKRVVHDRLVSLDERFEYLQETYGKTPEARNRLMSMKDQTLLWEKKIFRHLDFGPQDVIDLVE